LHASLLPKYPGAAPIQWAIASGETITEIRRCGLMRMDTGEMLLQEELRIGAEETAPEIGGRTERDGSAVDGGDACRGLAKGELAGRAQDHARLRWRDV